MREPSQRIQRLSLFLPRLGSALYVVMCDGSTGKIDEPNKIPSSLMPIESIELIKSNGQILWAGKARISKENSTVELIVSLENETEYFLWNELPEALSIFDGGYSLLRGDEWRTFFEEVLSFPEVITARVHYGGNADNFFLNLTIPKQDPLKTFSEFLGLTDENNSQPLAVGSVCIVEIEIFERTVFLLSVLDDREGNQCVFRLTEYNYLSNRRSGNRILLAPDGPTLVDDFKLTEVSDFGLRLESNSDQLGEGACLKLPIGNQEIKFVVIYSKKSGNGKYAHGLHLAEDSPAVRKAWQRFLLPFQYPSLSYRNEHDHEKFWKLYYDTGYMDFSYTKYLEKAKRVVFNTWSIIDEIGPALGASVYASQGERMVSSIGVAKVGGGICVAQAANTLAEPQYLKHTRSMYSWRTRFILQQPDCTYHLAFLHRDKKFLDRFFRSFYLKKNDSRIIWDEWNLFVLENTIPAPGKEALRACDAFESNGTAEHGETLLSVLEKIKCGNFQIRVQENGHIIESIPHLHMMQYLSGVWSKEANTCPDKIFSSEHTFFSYYTRLETDSALQSLEKFRNRSEIIHEGWHVTWLCPKPLLTEFLSNSLKSLEIMNRKYKGETAA